MKLSADLDFLRRLEGYWYFATPYTLYPGGRHAAWIEACRLRGELTRQGVNVYSPIAETHSVQLFCDLTGLSHADWMEDDWPKIEAAGGLIFGRMLTWEKSSGMAHEHEYFTEVRKPIVYLDP